jgi:hypothetical protein
MNPKKPKKQQVSCLTEINLAQVEKESAVGFRFQLRQESGGEAEREKFFPFVCRFHAHVSRPERSTGRFGSIILYPETVRVSVPEVVLHFHCLPIRPRLLPLLPPGRRLAARLHILI